MTRWHKDIMVKMALLLFVSPVFIGLLGIIFPAIGLFPGLGDPVSITAPLHSFLHTPGLGKSIWLTLFTGFVASFASLIFTLLLLMAFASNRARGILAKLSGPLIAVPHSTIAIGILFLLAPSGWILRLISPELTGLMRAPTWGWVPDPAGWGLILGLMAKEIPFLTLVAIGAMATLPVTQMKRVGASLGYGIVATWMFVILPLVYRQIRLPLAAVLVFSLSVVDMVLILGPTVPPTLAVTVFNGFSDTDLMARLPSSAGACLSVVIVLCGLIIWRGGELLCHQALSHLCSNGRRLQVLDHFLRPSASVALLPIIAGMLGLIAALLWSIADHWRFPEAWPATFTMRHWLSGNVAGTLILNSLWLALAATATAISLTMIMLIARKPNNGNLDTGTKAIITHGPAGRLHYIILAPLLVPQIGFMFGLQIFLTWLHLDGSWFALIWIHALFVLPYSWLILAPAYMALDRKFLAVAASLGVTPLVSFWRVTLPLLAYPLATALLVGVAVSITLYLPTLFVSAGRINTLTLEAVALASGGNRSLTGVAAMLQIILPLSCFIFLQAGLYLRFRKFTGMRAGGLH